MIHKHSALRRTAAVLALVLVLCVGGFLLWAGDYYHADAEALAAQQADTTLSTLGRLTVLTPDHPDGTGIIFYPGAKVEPAAYLPLLERLRARGCTCVLVKMPLNLAIFDPNAADRVYDSVPGVHRWYIAGHSMGGAMASAYASKNPGRVQGLILLGAYLYGSYPVQNTLTVYGSLNTSVADKLDYTENVVCIEGGNHAQFGSYGRQRGDAAASISAQEQQRQAAEAIAAFIEGRAA